MNQGIRRAFYSFATISAGISLAACSSSDTASNSTSSTAEAPGSTSSSDATGVSGTASVFAAASLTNVAEDLAAAFNEENPDAQLEFNFAGSSALVRQISEGAPSDLFISADIANMDDALALPEFSGATSQVIATNKLVLVTADGNPGEISELSDVSDSLVAICAPEVPCGTITHEALDYANIELSTSSEEANVADVATKISTGAVDAGFVYQTDAQSLAKTQDNTVIELEGIDANEYPMALTTSGEDNEVAKAFAEFLTSDRAKEILASYGFGTN
ncbi:ABC transporter periplasmic component [Corynebacterium suranareeae]|uniref:ABC transporter periplasmic component n=1 Tax=Corynebacterium suranareeae TaxID=2506452 RepID=A0A169RNJ9_9CORY|nr:molybdate ABC transporter substrate-binding protein [Corynebacterium suranareeae]BAU94592.1 ABC transporter periplasmic component [Corynebacterium suranareeae]